MFDTKAFIGKDRSSKSKVKREETTPELSAASASAVSNPESTPTDVKMESVEEIAAPTPSSASRSGSRTTSRTTSRAGKPRDATKEEATEKRVKSFTDGDASRKLVVNRFYALLLPILLDVCAASVNSSVRAKAVLALLKMVNFCDTAELVEILNVRNFIPGGN